MRYYDVVWNSEPGGNIDHIAAHDLTTEDVEAILFNPVAEDVSRSSGRPLAFGFTADGRFVVVIYELLDKWTIYPVTAYEIEK